MPGLNASGRPSAFHRLFPWWRRRQPELHQTRRPRRTPVLLPAEIEPDALLRWIFEQRAEADDYPKNRVTKRRVRGS